MGRMLVTLSAGLLVAAGAAGAVPASGTQIGDGDEVAVVFSFTGDVQTFTVPAGVTDVEIVACGAQGADNQGGPGEGGLGGEATATISVVPEEVLTVVVGGAGAGRDGGFNGGGNREATWPVGGGGGGASDVRQDGSGLDERVVIGGGGGGAGYTLFFDQASGLRGGFGGGVTGEGGGSGLSGGDGGTATSGGGGGIDGGSDGQAGVGGDSSSGGGGGGGLFGGGGGGFEIVTQFPPPPLPPMNVNYHGAGGGGSGLGDSFVPGSCVGDGLVTITYEPGPAVSPFGVLVDPEGNTGSTVKQLPVHLSRPLVEPVTIDWETVNGLSAPGLAESGTDFVAAAGTVTFAPGETTQHVPLEFLADTVDEPALLWGEWGLVRFFNASPNAVLSGGFFDHGLFIIVDDD